MTGRLQGNFPGGTAALKWRFNLAGDRIRNLHIAPWARVLAETRRGTTLPGRPLDSSWAATEPDERATPART